MHRFAPPLLALALLATAAGCSQAPVAEGSATQHLVTTDAGDATGDGTSCRWEDAVPPSGPTGPNEPGSVPPSGPTGGTVSSPPAETFPVGAHFPSPDGCNVCECTPRGIACTAMACDPGVPVPVSR